MRARGARGSENLFLKVSGKYFPEAIVCAESQRVGVDQDDKVTKWPSVREEIICAKSLAWKQWSCEKAVYYSKV